MFSWPTPLEGGVLWKLGITVLAISVLVIAFLSVVATPVETGVEAEYAHLPEASDYGADYTASVPPAPSCLPNCPTDISAKSK
jgi:hypothetical protein